MSVKRIAIGVDYSEVTIRAAGWVKTYLSPNAAIVLAHAVDFPPVPHFMRALLEGRGDPIELQIADEQERLEHWRDAHCAGAAVVVREGRADAVLRAVVREHGAALLVIGAHGDREPRWARLGTTAERLLRAADCSMLIARGPMASAPTRILVAVDDAEITNELLAAAGALADRFDAHLHAVHVLSNAAYSHVLSMEAAETHSDAEAHAHVAADMASETLRWLRALWQRTTSRGHLAVDVAHGAPANEILHSAEQCGADLIMVGRYGAGRAARAVLGSVAGSVVNGAACPVLVVADASGR